MSTARGGLAALGLYLSCDAVTCANLQSSIYNRQSRICNQLDGRAESAKMSRSFPIYGACS